MGRGVLRSTMDPGFRALLSGFVAFVVATAATIATDPDHDLGPATRIGGLIGGSVALATYVVASRLPGEAER